LRDILISPQRLISFGLTIGVGIKVLKVKSSLFLVIAENGHELTTEAVDGKGKR
jgi:hypothetical protein